jgi:hypothetical protein
MSLLIAGVALAAAQGGPIYAQTLLDRAVARHPQVAALVMHVTPPGSAERVIVASNAGSAGKGAEAAGNRLKVELPLLDASRRTVGALAVVFRARAGGDEAARQREAEAIRDELARRISHAANLMDPARFDAHTPTDTYAQALVDQTLAGHGELLILAMHVTPPGRSDNVILASNIGRIGKKADEDDLAVIRTGKTKLEVNATGDRFEVELPLHDASGKPIGALGVVFPYKQDDDQAALQKKAEQVRDEMARRIPSVARLVGPKEVP